MTLENPYAIPFFGIGMMVLGVLAFGVVARHRTRVFWEFTAMVGSTAVHTLAYALDLASTSLEQKLLFHEIAWLGFAVTPGAALLLALRFSSDRPRRGLAAAIGVVALFFAALAWTNEQHHLLEGPASLVEQGGYVLRAQDRGPLFGLYFLYASACALTTLGIYGASWMSGPAVRRRHARALFLAMLAPWVLNFVFFSGHSIIRPTPFALGISALVIAWAFFRDGLLELVPIAHEKIIATLHEPIFVFDGEGRLVDRNPAARELTAGELSAGDRPHGRFAFLGSGRATDERSVIAVGERCFESRSIPLGEEGRVVTLYDVTAREAHAEATERALEVRSEFIARMSHELRTPLQGVLGSLELLERSGVGEAKRRHVETARSSARVLLSLVDEVLGFERAGGDLTLEDGEVAPRAIVDDVAAAVGATARLEGLALETDLEGADEARLRGDAGRIRQILLNLAANAVKFTPRGVVRIGAETAPAAAGRAVSFWVEDSGPGIPEASLPEMFEPFAQLESGRTRRRGGVGLGLAICRRLADAMGGAITLENREKGGLLARFEITLPLSEEAAPRSLAPEPREAIDAEVLLVEDHPVSRAVVTEMLEGLGARVEAVDSGAAALERASRARFDLALVDLHMPGMDGLATTRGLLALPSPPRVVIFTADEGEGVRGECLGAGAAEVLRKPATLPELAAVLQASTARPPGDPSRARLLEAFASTFPGEIGALRRAVEEGDGEASEAILHGMIGASALLGLSEVAARCREASLEPTPEHVARIEAACAAAAG